MYLYEVLQQNNQCCNSFISRVRRSKIKIYTQTLNRYNKYIVWALNNVLKYIYISNLRAYEMNFIVDEVRINDTIATLNHTVSLILQEITSHATKVTTLMRATL